MTSKWIVAGLLIILPLTALALGPHEVLVLVNDKSADSIVIAEEFVKIRAVPVVNVVHLRVPVAAAGSAAEITPEDFTHLIWIPANNAVRDRGIGDHILAWVYSADFPIMVKTNPVISVLGLTFLRNKHPGTEEVQKGLYLSQIFSGVNRGERARHFPQTFDVYDEWLGNDMPLPNMMLGYTGERGNKRETVIRCLKDGAASDGSMPSGTVFFVKSEDVRSKCRQWQFPDVVAELKYLDVDSEITETFPAKRKDVMGIMMGAETVNPDRGNVYLPGCMAEHLTSAAAIFHGSGQTKLSAWIEAGATASAGTVTEPLSIWSKFPNARFYAYYAAGCTMMESFYQSIRCPLQILLVGEPLAQPWAPGAKAVINGLEKETLSGTVEISVKVESKEFAHYGMIVYLLDGRTIGKGATFKLNTASHKDGPHVLRAVAYRTGLVRRQVFAEKNVVFGNGGN